MTSRPWFTSRVNHPRPPPPPAPRPRPMRLDRDAPPTPGAKMTIFSGGHGAVVVAARRGAAKKKERGSCKPPANRDRAPLRHKQSGEGKAPAPAPARDSIPFLCATRHALPPPRRGAKQRGAKSDGEEELLLPPRACPEEAAVGLPRGKRLRV
jgi:hypothetical protein